MSGGELGRVLKKSHLIHIYHTWCISLPCTAGPSFPGTRRSPAPVPPTLCVGLLCDGLSYKRQCPRHAEAKGKVPVPTALADHPGRYGEPAQGGQKDFLLTNDSDARAQEIEHGLIQRYIGPDHKVIDMKAFFSALVEGLWKARQSSEQQNRTRVRKPDVAFWHLADLNRGAGDVGLGVRNGHANPPT